MITTRDLNALLIQPGEAMVCRARDGLDYWVTDRYVMWNVDALGGLRGGWPHDLPSPSAHVNVTKGGVKSLGTSNFDAKAITHLTESAPSSDAPTVEWTSYATLVRADLEPRAARLGLYDGQAILANADVLAAILTVAADKDRRWKLKFTANHPERSISVWQDVSAGIAYAPNVKASRAPSWRLLGLIMAVRAGDKAELARIAAALRPERVKASA